MDKVGEQTLEVMSTATWYNKWIFDMSEKYLGKKVLEIGSGIGNFTKLIKDKRSVYATDINNGYLKLLKSRHGDVISGFGDIETNKFFFKNERFDSVIAFNVLEHIEHDRMAIDNVYKLLKSGGRFIVIVPAHRILFSKFDENLGHFRRYNIKNLREKMESSGFKIKSIRYLNWIGAIGWLLFIKIMKRSVMPKNEVGIFNIIGPYMIGIERFIKFPFGLSVFCIAEK